MIEGTTARGAAHDAVRSMLEGRAERLRPAPFDLPTLIADVPQVADRLSWLAILAPRLSVAGAAAAVVLVASALVAGPLLLRPAGPAVPSAGVASLTPSGSAAPANVRALTAAEVGDLARTRSTELASQLAAVRGTITVVIDPRCSGAACATATLDGAGEGFVLRPSMALVTEFTRGRAYPSGVFVVQFTGERDRDRPVVDVLGRLVTNRVDSFTNSVRQLVAESPGRGGSYAAVDGWLVRTALQPCPSIVVPSAASEAPVYGCPADEYLTDEAFQPTRPGGGSVGPESGIYLPVGSYQLWAPDPMAIPDGGVAPRRAVYLLQKQQVSGCPAVGEGCALQVSRWGVIAGRFDPIPGNPATASPAPPDPRPSGPPVAAGSWPGGIPRSIDGQPVLVGLAAQQRISDAVDDTSFLVGGPWFDGPQVCLGGIAVNPDPNPLAVRGCPRYRVEGLPPMLFPATLIVPEERGPIAFRVHTRDPRAATCRDVEACRRVVVVETVAWAGDDATRTAPFDVGRAMGELQTIIFANNRKTGPNEFTFVDEDVFTIPIACPAPWPVLTYAIHGDPRLGRMAVFRSTVDRELFQASNEAASAGACLEDEIARYGPARWIGRANMLLLAFADDADAKRIDDSLGRTPGSDGWKPVPLPGPDVDMGREVIAEYLAARIAGLADHAVGERLQLDQSDQRIDVYAGWHADTFRRLAANALDGSITLVSDQPSEADVGTSLWRTRPAGSDLFIYRVDYPGATDPALASETFVVIHDPVSSFADWMFVRVGGAPYPEVLAPPPAPEPSTSPDPATDGSGDIPCGPTPCGETFPSTEPSAGAQ